MPGSISLILNPITFRLKDLSRNGCFRWWSIRDVMSGRLILRAGSSTLTRFRDAPASQPPIWSMYSKCGSIASNASGPALEGGSSFSREKTSGSCPTSSEIVRGPIGYAWSIAEGPVGTLWVATGKGLYRLKGSEWSEIHLPFAGATEVNRMIAAGADGTLWIQSNLPYPILHLKVEGKTATVVEQVSGATIASDNTTFVETDQRGWLWVGSDDGLRVFDGRRWVLCTAEDGLIWNDTDFHAFFADPDGSVWVGTSAGVSHLLHPEHLFDHAAPRATIGRCFALGSSDSSRYIQV